MRTITRSDMARIAESLARKGGGLLEVRYECRDARPDALYIGYNDNIGSKGVVINEGQDYSKAMNIAQK